MMRAPRRVTSRKAFTLVELVVALAVVAVVAAIAYPQINLANSTAQDSQVKASMNAALTATVRTYATASLLQQQEQYYGGLRTPQPVVSSAAVRNITPDLTVTATGVDPSTNDREVSIGARFMDDGRFWRIGVAALATSGDNPDTAGCWMAWRDLEPPVGAQSQVASGPVLEAYFFVPAPDLNPQECTGERAAYAQIPGQALTAGSTLAANWNTPAILSAAPVVGSSDSQGSLSFPDTVFVQQFGPGGVGQAQTLTPVSTGGSQTYTLTGDLPTIDATTPAVTFDTVTGSLTGPGVWPYAFSEIDTAGDTTCGITVARDSVVCWGAHTPSGVAGNPAVAAQPVPGILDGTGGARPVDITVAATTNSAFACVLYSDGTVRCFGDNSAGQLGNSATAASSSIITAPTWVVTGDGSKLENVVGVSAGLNYACAVADGGQAYCWGSPDAPALGPGGDSSLTARPVTGIPDPVSVIVASKYPNSTTCAVTTSAGAYCWGSNASGKAGVGSPDPTTGPAQVLAYGSDDQTSALTAVSGMSLGPETTCAVVAQGVKCWGDADSAVTSGAEPVGESGVIDAAAGNVVNLPAGSSVVSVSSGIDHACARTVTGQVVCWGTDAAGELGRGERGTSTIPQLVFDSADRPLFSVQQLTVSGQSNCVVIPSGVIRCWGFSATGGTGSTEIVGKATRPELSGVLQGFPASVRVDGFTSDGKPVASTTFTLTGP